MEKISCPICNQNKFKYILTGKDNINHIPGDFEIVKCTHCSLMFTNPRPNSNEIKKYYPKVYKPYKINFSQASKIADLRNKYNWLYKIIDSKATLGLELKQKNANILEIGCGAGNFLFELKQFHPNWNITGTDFNQKSIDILKKNKINAFVSDLTILPMQSKSIDIVYGWMIIEHVHNLSQALSEVHRVLKNGGRFVFSVPNAGCWEFKLFGRYWFALQLPTHLYHFTQDSISKLLKKNGFKVEKVIHQRTFSNVPLSIQIVVENSSLPNNLKKILTPLFNWNTASYFFTLPLATLLAVFKQSGRLTIIAQKI